jgi:hypothetical protein
MPEKASEKIPKKCGVVCKIFGDEHFVTTTAIRETQSVAFCLKMKKNCRLINSLHRQNTA